MKRMKTIAAATAAGLLVLSLLSGCSRPGYEGFVFPAQGESVLKDAKTEGYYIQRTSDELKAEAEKTTESFSSDDGLCVIEKKADYYDVTLECEKGSDKDIGKAYAQAVVKACPDYGKTLDGYLFEILKDTFGSDADYDAIISGRLASLVPSLDESYREQLDSFASEISNDKHGVKKDGILSYEEAALMSMVPDVVRSTSCSVMTVNGNKSTTGHRLAARMLEWELGSEKQICRYQCVTHFKNGSKSFTAVGSLGMMDILTAVNSSGVAIGELDVGSYVVPYNSEGKTCYSFDLRYVMENCTSARQGAEYLASGSELYKYNINAFVADEKEALYVELVVGGSAGKTVIRDCSTELNDGLNWSDPDCFCIVNSFAAKGNPDMMTTMTVNMARWVKYDRLFSSEKEKISPERFKALMTSEKVKDSPVTNFRSENMVHMAVFDFDSGTIQVLFGGKEDPDEIKFIDLGKLF